MRLKWPASFVALSALALVGCLPKPIPNEPGKPEWGVQITWHGHSCFTLKDSIGRTVVTDPFDDTVGYPRLILRADALLISHSHFDHNYRQAVRPRLKDLEVAETSTTQTMAGQLSVTGIGSFHDRAEGKLYGENKIFTFYMGGLRIVHMGDFNEVKVSESQKKALGPIDILFIPIGGFTTLDPKEAKSIIDQLQPRAVFPMHYGDIRFYKLADIKPFTDLFAPDQVKVLSLSSTRLTQGDLGKKPLIFVLTPTNRNY